MGRRYTTKRKIVKDSRPIEARAISALRRTWQVIGYDCLQADGEDSMDAELVRESVSTCGFATGYPADYGDDDEAVEWLEKQSHEEQERILKLAFPNGNYGM